VATLQICVYYYRLKLEIEAGQTVLLLEMGNKLKLKRIWLINRPIYLHDFKNMSGLKIS
jgi:hypothetical protein